MLDCFAVFDRGGSVLWLQNFITLTGSPLDAFVREVLLQERTSDSQFLSNAHRVQWALDNELGLVFACVSPKAIPMPYVPDLLELCRLDFLDKYADQLRDPASHPDAVNCDDFAQRFAQLRDFAELRAKEKNRRPAPVAASKPKAPQHPKATHGPASAAKSTFQPPPAPSPADMSTSPVASAGTNESLVEQNKARFIASNLAKRNLNRRRPSDSSTVPRSAKTNGPGTAPGGDNAPLDHSVGAGPPLGSQAREVTEEEVEHSRKKYLNAEEASSYDLLDEYDDDDLDQLADRALGQKNDAQAPLKSKRGVSGVFGFLQGLAGKVDLSAEDLAPALTEFREMLMSKNVAPEIAEQLCNSVGSSLVGKRMESLSTIRRTVHTAMASALTRILTPKQSVDLLVDIETAKRESSRPYVIVFW